MRRVVTGHRDGKSVIIDDAEISSEPIAEGLFGVDIAELWATEGIPPIPVEESESKKRLSLGIPERGGTRVGIAWLHPDKEVFSEAKEKGFDVEGAWRQFFNDDFGMHTTDTVDYGIVLSGEIWLELDASSKTRALLSLTVDAEGQGFSASSDTVS